MEEEVVEVVEERKMHERRLIVRLGNVRNCRSGALLANREALARLLVVSKDVLMLLHITTITPSTIDKQSQLREMDTWGGMR